jgi:hypothetical protein
MDGAAATGQQGRTVTVCVSESRCWRDSIALGRCSSDTPTPVDHDPGESTGSASCSQSRCVQALAASAHNRIPKLDFFPSVQVATATHRYTSPRP